MKTTAQEHKARKLASLRRKVTQFNNLAEQRKRAGAPEWAVAHYADEAAMYQRLLDVELERT